MYKIEIKSAKLKDLFAEYSYEQIVEEIKNLRTNEVTVNSDAPVHDDFKQAFKQLNSHLALLCEQVSYGKPEEIAAIMDNIENDYDKFTDFKVTAFKITGTGESEAVVLTGQRKLSNGKVLNLNCPNTKFEDEYQFMPELIAALNTAKNEVLEYHNGKRAPEKQQDLFEDEDGELLDQKVNGKSVRKKAQMQVAE